MLRVAALHFPCRSQSLLESANLTVSNLKKHSSTVNKLRRRHEKLTRALLAVMQQVDDALAPTSSLACAEAQAVLSRQLEGLLGTLAAPSSGLVARARQLVLLQSEMASHASSQRAGAVTASDDARLSRHLPEITAHLERQQATLKGLADMLKADQTDLEIIAREVRSKRGRSRGVGSAVDAVAGRLD